MQQNCSKISIQPQSESSQFSSQFKFQQLFSPPHPVRGVRQIFASRQVFARTHEAGLRLHQHIQRSLITGIISHLMHSQRFLCRWKSTLTSLQCRKEAALVPQQKLLKATERCYVIEMWFTMFCQVWDNNPDDVIGVMLIFNPDDIIFIFLTEAWDTKRAVPIEGVSCETVLSCVIKRIKGLNTDFSCSDIE